MNNEKSEIVSFCELMKIVSTNVTVFSRLLLGRCQIETEKKRYAVLDFIYAKVSKSVKLETDKNLPETARMNE